MKPFGQGVLLSEARSIYIQSLLPEQRDKLVAAIAKHIRYKASSKGGFAKAGPPRDWYR
jgi:hypothetical protein